MDLLDRVARTVEDVQDPALDTTTTVLEQLLRLLQEDPTSASAATAGAAAGSYGLWRIARRLLPLAVPLYARLRGLDLARHPKRAALLAAIHAHPAATTAELVRATKMNKGTALHHLRALERGGLVRSRRMGRDRAWTDAGARLEPDAEALHAPARRAIVALARERPGLTQAALARELGLARATMHHHVRALADAGVLDIRRKGWRTRCFVKAAATSG